LVKGIGRIWCDAWLLCTPVGVVFGASGRSMVIAFDFLIDLLLLLAVIICEWPIQY
jgi:hypothetical protein